MRSRADHAPPFAVAASVLGALVASRFLAIGVSPGEIDEAVFAGAVIHYDLFTLSPQAPGFPVWILIGKALVRLVPSPFVALTIASTLLSALAIPALYAWSRRLVGGWAALAGLVPAALLPVVWVNGGRGFSDSPATAFFLLALAALAAAGDEERGERAARVLAVWSGVLAALGAGVRPHLVIAFGPLLLVHAVRLFRRPRRDAAVSFVLAGLAATAAWLAWLTAQAGGPRGLLASLTERSAFRSQAFATGTLGAFTESFLVRDFLGPAGATVAAVLAVAGVVALALGARRALLDLALVLVPLTYSLWFLHSREMSRYSVPFVLVAAPLLGAGLVAILRARPLALAAGLALAAIYAPGAYEEARRSATEEMPPSAAIAHVARYHHAGRETVIADDDLHSFLRLARWEGALWGWAYVETEVVSGPRQMNRRVVRIADLTGEPESPDAVDHGWKVWRHDGAVASALGNRRLLTVGLRDPAPPVFGPGFGLRERESGRSSFRWCGPGATLIVPGLVGPPVAILSGERPGYAGATTLRVRDASGREVVSRRVPAGPLELAIVRPRILGPLPEPSRYTISCDDPIPLPPSVASLRPDHGCFTFREWARSMAPEDVWEPIGKRYLLDVGSLADRGASPLGFHPAETDPTGSTDTRWTTAESSVIWIPRPAFTPRRLALRARAPFEKPVDVSAAIAPADAAAGAEVAIGTLRVAPGDLAEVGLDLPPSAAERLAGPDLVRIVLRSSAASPRETGHGADDRRIGVAVDRIILE